jgi:protease IV
MSDSPPPFWPTMLRRFASIFFTTASVGVSLAVVATGLSIFGGIMAALSDTEATEKAERYRFVSGDSGSRNRILSMDVVGPILGTGSDSNGFGLGVGEITYGYQIQSQLQDAAEDKQIKAVFLRFITPGGTIYGSQAIFDGIKAYKKATGNPVYVYIEGISASGGVWAMVGADKIYADHGSMIGSIGVIGPQLQYFNRPKAIDGGLFGGGVATDAGIENIVISAGRGKDLGNPFRRPTPEELAVLQAGVNTEYDNFVRHVAQARGIAEDVIRNKMGAMIFDNKAAKQWGLIDGTLSRQGVLDQLIATAKLKKDDYQLVSFRPKSVSLLSGLLGSAPARPSAAKIEQLISQDLCTMTQQRVLVYHGNPLPLCRMPPAP